MQKEEWEINHRDHENRTGYARNRAAFMKAWSVVQCYRAQSMLRTGLKNPLMQEILEILDKW